jgi:VCBS repeat-containing protein
MARQIANVDIQVDTFGSWVTRTNQLFESLSNEIMTANSTSGITGSTTSPRNATLHGRFSTNNVFTSNTFQVANCISANSTTFIFGPTTRIVANNRIGVAGQILAIGTGGYLYWTNAGLGTVTRVQGGNGLNGDITSSGSLTVKPSDGIKVSSAGVAVDSAYIATLTSANTAKLNSKTWEAPAGIGTTTPNVGKFTAITGTSYSITGDTVFVLNENVFRTPGYIESITPASGTRGGINLRAADGGNAKLRVTDYLGSTVYGTVTVDSTGEWSWSGDSSTTGSFAAATASLTGNLSISTANALGGGISISDAGDIADLNDGYASMRFTNGIKIYSASKGGTGKIALNSNGTIYSGSSKFLTSSDFTTSAVSNGGYTKLPNGIIMAWGTAFVGSDSSASITFPSALFTNVWNVQLTHQDTTTGSGSPQGSSAVSGLTNTGFTIYNDGTARNHYWFVVGN